MRSNVARSIITLGVVAAFGLLGCSSEGHDDGDDGTTGAPTTAPEFTEGQGQPARDAEPYPAAPYGVSEGSVISNYKFIGYPNAASELALKEIHLAHFYNPTGAEKYPADAPFNAGQDKPKALLITIAARWCPPCNLEAGDTLPGKYAELKPLGGEFLLYLGEGNDAGTAALTTDLNKWTSKYDIDYPATIDPTYKLWPLVVADAWPANFLIKTSTMEIVEAVAGTPPSSFWSKFKKVLNGEL